jgi:hypothetical protein
MKVPKAVTARDDEAHLVTSRVVQSATRRNNRTDTDYENSSSPGRIHEGLNTHDAVQEEGPLWMHLRLISVLCILVYLTLRQYSPYTLHIEPVRYTVRVNTFRRNDLLEKFLEHYVICPDIEEIQVRHGPSSIQQIYFNQIPC